MADLSITPGNVAVEDSSTRIQSYQIGTTTVAAGDVLYLDASTSKYEPAQCDGTVAQARVRGIALTGGTGGADTFHLMVTSGMMDLGTTLDPGESYVLSANAGKIKLSTELVSTEYLTHLFYALEADRASLRIVAEGEAI